MGVIDYLVSRDERNDCKVNRSEQYNIAEVSNISGNVGEATQREKSRSS